MEESNISWDAVEQVQSRFWEELLRDISTAEDRAEHSKQIAKLMPFLRTEINLAAASLMVESSDQKRWEMVADKRRSLLKMFEGFGVSEEYAMKLEDNYKMYATETYAIRDIFTHQRLPINGLKAFLRSGNTQELERDPYLSKVLRLSNAIYGVEPVGNRDKLLQSAGMYFGQRDISYPFFLEGDTIARYKGNHLELLSELVRQGRYDDVAKAIDILSMSSVAWFSARYSPDGSNVEPAQFRYPTELLETKDIDDLHKRCRFEYLLYSLSGLTNPFRLEVITRDLINTGDIRELPLDFLQYTKEKRLPDQKSVIEECVSKLALHEPTQRALVTTWLENYQDAHNQLSHVPEEDAAEQQRILLELDRMSQEINDKYPELVLAHNLIMTDYYRYRDYPKAKEYYDSVVDFYNTRLRARLEELSIQLNLGNSNNNKQYIEIAEKYEILGFGMIANFFRNKVYINHSPSTWQVTT